VPYANVMEIDAEMRTALEQAPKWMQVDPETEMPYHFAPSVNPSLWIQWQRMNYLVNFFVRKAEIDTS